MAPPRQPPQTRPYRPADKRATIALSTGRNGSKLKRAPMTTPWMIYGANGYTGELITRFAAEKGLKTVTEYGEAAFYGPKLDFMVKDAIGRKWQLGTIQVDYNLPERFELEYTGSDNQKHRPVMIHSSSASGSIAVRPRWVSIDCRVAESAFTECA